MTPHQHNGAGRGPMSATEHFLVLQRQSRVRRWSFAVVLGAAAGLFANLVLDWPLALLAATVTAVALLWWDSQYGTLMAWWPGNRAPHRLAAAAARLERHDWTVLPAPAIPHHDPHRTTIYLLIGPGGVFVVEHQVWTVEDAVTRNSRTGLLLVAGQPAARRTGAVRAAAAAVEDLLADDRTAVVPVTPVLAVDAPTLDQHLATIGVIILPSTDLTRYLRSIPIVLDAATIAALTEAARRLFTPEGLR